MALAPVVKFHDLLVAAGQPPETHVYVKGGHGFGMKHQGTDSDRWIDDFQHWLRSLGMTDAVPHPHIPASPHRRQ